MRIITISIFKMTTIIVNIHKRIACVDVFQYFYNKLIITELTPTINH